MLFYMCILELRAARRVQNDLSDRLAALEQGAAPPAGGAARPNQPPAGGPAPFNQPPAGGPAPPIQPPAEGPPPPNQPHEERPSSSQSHEMDDDAGPSPLAALETKFLLMFQQFEGNIHGMLERIELLEAAAISNQRQLHSPPVASSPATFSPSSPPQPLHLLLYHHQRVTPSVPKTSSSLLAPSTPLPKPLDPLDSFPTKCVAPGTHTSSPSVPTCREPLIGRVVLRPPSPPALEDLGVPQQRGPEVREQSTPPPTSSSAARQATVSVSTGSTPSAEPSPQPFRLRTLMRRRPEAWVVPVDWTTQWGSSCNEDATTEHRNGTCSATSTTTRSTSTFLIVFFTTTISTPAPIHATNSRRTVTTTAQLIYCPASLGPSATGQTDSTSCSATQPPAGAILTLQKKE
ncbi:hypothetical protein EMCRGX_G001242 [Ephydatia muelleri]